MEGILTIETIGGDIAAAEVIKKYLPDLALFDDVFERITWAEEEISKAMARHGEQPPPEGKRGTGPIWNAFRLLRSTHQRLGAERLYRAHCHELLDRVAKGEDTRPATDAEIIVILQEAALAAPLNEGAVCLFFRLALRSIPEMARALGSEIDMTAYESIHGRKADEYEVETRYKGAQDWRI